jgi:hypothetical protein
MVGLVNKFRAKGRCQEEVAESEKLLMPVDGTYVSRCNPTLTVFDSHEPVPR